MSLDTFSNQTTAQARDRSPGSSGLASTDGATGRARSGGGLRRLLRSLRGLYVLFDLSAHRALTKIMRRPGLNELARKRPLVLFKYLHTNYLAHGFDRQDRRAILACHYLSLAEALPPAVLQTLLNSGKQVWESGSGEEHCCIVLGFPGGGHDFEGEICGQFQLAGQAIYSLTVTAARLGASDAATLLVSNVQGCANALPAIRRATSLMHDMPPAYLLLAALEGLAVALGAQHLAGVGNDRQLSKVSFGAQAVRFDYDGFWEKLGATKSAQGLYWLPARIPEKPIEQVKRKHRSKILRKRALKRSIAASVAAALGSTFPPADKPEPDRTQGPCNV